MQVSSVKNKLHQLKNLQDFNLAIVIKMEFVFGVCGVGGVGFLITPYFSPEQFSFYKTGLSKFLHFALAKSN